MNWRRIGWTICTMTILVAIILLVPGYRSVRLAKNATDLKSQINYLIESGGTIGETPADTALSSSYLEIIFGNEPELLAQLKEAVERGTKEMPDVQQGEISAIIVTYRKNGDERIENVIAHVMGGFPLGKRKISMHRDGFFANQIDRNLWTTGDSSLKFLGRDMVVWSNSEDDEREQREIIEAIFSGEVQILADNISKKPIYYTAVFPNPSEIVPPKMRNHIRAMIMNGSISPEQGSMEMILLSNNEKSTALVASMAQDLKAAMQIALRTRFAGVQVDSPWGPYVPVWWAYEMANTMEDVQLSRRDLTVRLSVTYERRMVNATLKTIERFGRDFSQIRGVQEEKLDPRVVDARMETRSPLHYWSDQHRWGPDWPFGSSTNVLVRRPEDADRTLQPAPPVTQP